MANTDELRYIQAFSRIIGVKEDDAIEYTQKKGLNALVDNATQLLTTPAQREKHQAFLDLYRMSSGINARNPIINSPESASDFFHSVMDKIYDKEAFVVAFLNTKNRVIDHEVVSVGTINSSIVHPREVFRNAIINKANSVILCHNHPSGDLTPSAEDISITERLKETGNLLGIRVLDHLIINGINMSEIYSFKTHGVLETPKTYNTAKSVLNEETDYNFTKATNKQSVVYNVPMQEHDYPLPDPDISIADRNSYGYLNDEMLPLSQERAAELFEQDLTVYMLYEDDTEAMAFEREDIDNHSGLFGIEKNDWTALQDYEELKGDGRLSPEIQEQLFLESTKDAFAIYQLKSGEEYRDYRFEGLERLQNAGLEVTHENYDFIYTASLSDFNGSVNNTLNQLYEQFNINHPTGFTGHSLSVSDIIVLKIDDVVSSHYVDSFGFQELPQFLEPALLVPDHFLTGERIDTPRGSFSLTSMTREQMAAAGYGYHHSSDDGKYHIMGNGTRAFAIKNEDSYLRTAEISTEQNFNKIDGILNNQPTVAELEETVKSGGTISLLDLANAVQAEKREKRTSVVEQLKSKPLQEKEKSKKAPSVDAEMER